VGVFGGNNTGRDFDTSTKEHVLVVIIYWLYGVIYVELVGSADTQSDSGLSKGYKNICIENLKMNPSLDVHFDEMYGEEMVVSSMDIF
jgi:hypothetical protein